MQRLLITFLAVLSIGSLTGFAWMLARPAAPDPRVATLEIDLQKLRRENARLREEADRKAKTAANPSKPGAPAAAADKSMANTGSASAAATTSSAPKGANGLRDMLSAPGMRSMMEQQQAVQIDMGYGRLFDILQLNDPEKANLKQLLLDRSKGQMDAALKMMDPNLTPEQRKQFASDMAAEKAKYDEKFKTFLNDENDYKTFQQWEDTQPERMMYDMMGRSLFSQSGEPLTAEQEQQLIATAAEARKAPGAGPTPNDPAFMDPTHLTEAAIQKMEQRLQQNDDQVAAKAANFLSPVQLKTLQTYQEQARNMAMTGMKMSATMTGAGQGGK